jgi:hypothetical protein
MKKLATKKNCISNPPTEPSLAHTDDEPGNTAEHFKSQLDTCQHELYRLVEPEVDECEDKVGKSNNGLYKGSSRCKDGSDEVIERSLDSRMMLGHVRIIPQSFLATSD